MKKILCILEGRDELKFVKKVCETILSKPLSCEEFLNIAEILWGKGKLYVDKSTCNFQGGNKGNCKTPFPALEALEYELDEEDMSLYKGIVIMYDKDCDENNIVKNKIKDFFEEINLSQDRYLLYISDPCLEKEILIIVKNDETENYIRENYKEINNSRCKWFKQNFRLVPKKDPYKYFQKCERVIENLRREDLENSKMGHKFLRFLENKI